MKHILFVYEDDLIIDLLTENLAQHALRITAVTGRKEVARVVSRDAVDLVIVNLDFRPQEGLDIVRNLSFTADVPVIITSGNRLSETDKVLGLELGAGDYIAKPFGIHEFVARVRARLRERHLPVHTKNRSSYLFNDWRLHIGRRQLFAGNGKEVKLTIREFNLLVAFLDAPKRILTREQLLSASRVGHEEVFDRSVDVAILRLRRKIETDASAPGIIKTERGIGYFLDSDVTIEQHR